jgi:hypothetical protein
VNIWNNGYTAASGTIPIMSAVACRWHALNLLRTFVYRRENPGLAFIGAQLPAALGGLPQVYWKFWRNPRLSTVGAEIGSDTVRNKSKHIDIDWFGPAGDGVDCNWWVGEVDGHAEETATARALIDLLELALNTDGHGGALPDSWTWSPNVKRPENPFDAINDIGLISQAGTLSRALRPKQIRIEWKVRHAGWQGGPYSTEFAFTVQERANDFLLVIITPDANAPDPN